MTLLMLMLMVTMMRDEEAGDDDYDHDDDYPDAANGDLETAKQDGNPLEVQITLPKHPTCERSIFNLGSLYY